MSNLHVISVPMKLEGFFKTYMGIIIDILGF